jgi:putative transcriptional regulator
MAENESATIQRLNTLYMPIVVTLDIMLARRKMSLTTLSQETGRTINSLSRLKNNRIKQIKTELIDKLCNVLECKPSDLLDYVNDVDFK